MKMFFGTFEVVKVKLSEILKVAEMTAFVIFF